MKRHILLLISALIVGHFAFGQKYMTKNGDISFYSKAQLEDIEAHNKQVNAALDIETGEIVFKVLIKSFVFEKALMQEHFNENYLESDKFPNSTLKATIQNIGEIDFTKDGKYDVVIEGELMVHGVTQRVKERGVLEIKDDASTVVASSGFYVFLKDYRVEIPGAVTGKISEQIKIVVNAAMEKL